MRMPARHWVAFSIAVLVAAFTGLAAAQAPPWVSAPSGQYVGQMAEIFGGGMAAGSTVTVQLTDPIGIVYKTPVKVATDGSISYTVPLARPGHYRAEVFSKAGLRLAGTLFGVAAPSGQ